MSCTLQGCHNQAYERYQNFCSVDHLKTYARRQVDPKVTSTAKGDRVFFYDRHQCERNYEFSNFFPKKVPNIRVWNTRLLSMLSKHRNLTTPLLILKQLKKLIGFISAFCMQSIPPKKQPKLLEPKLSLHAMIGIKRKDRVLPKKKR